MKKLTAALLGLMLALCVCCLPALAEEKAGDDAAGAFVSKWVNEEGTVEIVRQDDELKAQIVRGGEYPAATCWEYSVAYDAETGTLVSVRPGVKLAITFGEEGGFDISETLREGCEAGFALDAQGRLVWQDDMENPGGGEAFAKIGNYDCTVWVCDRASIEIYWEEEGYKVSVTWASSAFEETEWMYSCYYDPETDSLMDPGTGIRSESVYGEGGEMVSHTDVYDDGEAVFSLDADGHLVWKDMKEDAGAGMVFELAAM